MAASFNESQKIDYLWKKVGYGVTKTAEPASKEAFNESIPSPLLYRGDLIWTQSGDIPATPPASTTSLVQVYKDGGGAGYSPTVQCTEDLTAPDNQTWKTNLINWIPTQFGDNYLVQVYAGPTGLTNPQTAGTKLFGAGSGSDDTWFFDYQSGVLNFNGATIPTAIGTGTANTIYVVGYRYVGEYGVDTTFISNGTSNVNIATANGNITMGVDGTSNIAVISNTGAYVSGVVSASGNVTGNYFIGNGSQLTGVAASSVNANALIGNTLSSNVLYSSLTQVGTLSNVSISGNVVGGNVLTDGVVSATGNIQGNVFIGNGAGLTSLIGANVSGQVANALIAGTVYTNAQPNITSVGILTSASVSGNITGGNVLTGGVVSATGNVTSSGVITTGPSGNISGANVVSATTFTATGNISGNYFLGNGSQLTGIDATSIQNGNSNVRVSANSNVSVSISGISNVVVFATDGQYISGLLSVTGNVTSGNVTTSSVSSTSALNVNSSSNGNILLSANGSGIVKITGNIGFVVPVGNTAQRPVPVDDGTLRLNSTLNELEVYTSGGWQTVGSSAGNITVTDQQIDPNGTNTVYTLNQVATPASIMVSINGVTQIPNYGYTVTGNSITFAEAPLTTDYVDIRFLTSTVATPGALFNTGGNSSIQVNDIPEVSFTVNNSIRTKITANGIMDISTGRSIKMPLYTVAQADALTGRTEGEMIYVQNGDSGAACLAVFAGGAWKRVILGAAISG